MSLKADIISNEEKLRVIGEVIDDLAKRNGGQVRNHPFYYPLKVIARDIKGRIDLPRSNPLGEIERALQRTYESKTAIGYDSGQLQAVAGTLMKHWPIVKQALEHFGEVSAE